MDDRLRVRLKSKACATIDEAAGGLYDLSRAIWSEPELGFQEVKAHNRLTEFLERCGFQVTRHYILDTGFMATVSSPSVDVTEREANPRPSHVGLMCEYDALPGVGHACGHNLIAEVAVAAALGLHSVMTSLPGGSRVTVLGTPAEEGGAGKVSMAAGGAFRGIDAALMAHPYRRNEARPLVLSRMVLEAEFTAGGTGEVAEEETANPTDAAVIAYQAASCMRRSLRRHCMLHCVMRGCDSHRADGIPRRAVLEYYLRAPNESDFFDLKRRLTACFDAAALATGCRVAVTEPAPPYRSLLSNQLLSDAYVANLQQLGYACLESDSEEPAGSTDFGNISHLVPGIHPMWRLTESPGELLPASTPANHSLEFAELSGQPAAQAATLAQAKALAMTAIDILLSADASGLRDRAWQEFETTAGRHVASTP